MQSSKQYALRLSDKRHRLLENKPIYRNQVEFRTVFKDFMRPRESTDSVESFVPFLQERDHLGRIIIEPPSTRNVLEPLPPSGRQTETKWLTKNPGETAYNLKLKAQYDEISRLIKQQRKQWTHHTLEPSESHKVIRLKVTFSSQ